MSHLRITGTVARATGFSARFDLELPLSGVTAVLGPSGAGKSTLLRGIAGFEPDAQLEVRIADLTLQSPGHTLPPHERPVSSVFQDSRLFPHLDVRGNLNYPLKQARREGFRMGFDEVVDSLALGDLLEQPIDTLSGGQRQRVALGRALLAPARLWLLDEPLSALDSAARADIAPYLDQLCQAHRLPILYVSHALEEVLQLADRALVIDAGEVIANVPIEDLGETPLGARLAASVLDCEAGSYLADHDLTELHLGPDSIHLRGALPAGQSHIRLLIHARDVSIATGNVEGLSLLNRLHGRIRQIDHGAGGTSVVHLDCHGQRLLARITRLSAEQLDLRPGREVTALIKTVALATLNTQRLR